MGETRQLHHTTVEATRKSQPLADTASQTKDARVHTFCSVAISWGKIKVAFKVDVYKRKVKKISPEKKKNENTSIFSNV